MSLSQALATAVGGMRVNQAGLSIVAANVANAETPGWVRKTATQVPVAAGATGVGVRIAAINRELDTYIQRQMRMESSGASYAGMRAQFFDRLQSIYGQPGAVSTLENAYNEFAASLQVLTTSPEVASARSAVVNAAQVLAQQLNGMTTDVQSLRGDAELGLADSVARANHAMQRIMQINRQLATANSVDATTSSLLDQRDVYVDELAKLMDINVIRGDFNQLSVFTNSGIQLVGINASTLAFDPQGAMNPSALWSSDPSQRGVGTIVLKGPNGSDVDLLASNAIRSGEIAAFLEMRDEVLVQAQTQLDEIAAAMARALSDRTVDGTAVTAGPQAGFDIDLGSLIDGNSVTVTYTDVPSGQQRTLTLVRVDDPDALPLSASATSDPNDQVLGLDFSGGMASVITQLSSALGLTGLQFSNPAGTTLRVLDDGVPNKVNVDAVSATHTVTSLTGGVPELPLFIDGNAVYSGAITSVGPQSLGFAGRIAVNSNLITDPSRLVVSQTVPLTPSGDATRPNFLYDRLTNAVMTFSPQSGIGAATVPFSGSIHSFLRQVVSQQGAAADAAANLNQGQEVVYNALQQRFNDSAAVNIDQEMATLLSLQNAYAANARVLTTVKEMLDSLLRI
jgi:flagellar hook-associated protein 1 FlgK